MTGKMQINFFSPFVGLEFPFLNFMKAGAGFINNNPAFNDFYSLLNADGYPQSGSGWATGTTVYFQTGQALTLDWVGTGITCTLSANNFPSGYSLSENVGNRTANSREYIVTNAAGVFGTNLSVGINTSGSVNSSFANLRLYFNQYASLVSAGKRFDPNFLLRYANMGRVRFMDWMQTNGSNNARWGDRQRDTARVAFTIDTSAGNYCGQFTRQTNNDFAGTTGPTGWLDDSGNPVSTPTVWTDGQMIQGMAKGVAVTAITQASPAVMTVPGHGFSDGAVILGISMPGGYSSLQTSMQIKLDGVDPTNKFSLVFVSTGLPVDTSAFAAFSPGTFTGILEIPRFMVMTAFTNSSTAPLITTTTGHRLTVGKHVVFGVNTFSFSQRVNYVEYQVASVPVSPVDGNGNPTTFTLCQVGGGTIDASTWGAYSNTGQVAEVIRFSAGSLPPKRIVGKGLDSTCGFPSTSFLGSHFQAFQLTYNAAADALIVSPITANQSGACYEMLIAMANELNSSPWFCIPHMATDDFVTRLATLVKTNLNAGLVPCFEKSNETWNTGSGFDQTFFGQRLSYVLWPSQGLAGNGQAIGDGDTWFGMRFYQVMVLIDAVYAGSGLPYKRIMGIRPQNFGAGTSDNKFKAPLAVSGGQIPAVPATKIDSVAVAPYVDCSRSTVPSLQQTWNYVYGGAAGQAAAIAYLRANFEDDGSTNVACFKILRNTLFPFWATQAARAAGFGGNAVTLCMYEGGLGFNLTNSNSAVGYPGSFDGGDGQGVLPLSIAQKNQMFIDFFRSKEWAADFARSYMQDFQASGGEYPSQYATTTSLNSASSTANPFNLFGVISPNMFGTQMEVWNWMVLFNQGKRRLILKT